MARNVSKNVTPKSGTTSKSRSKGLFSMIDSVFNMDRILGGEFPAEQMRYLVWISFLIVLYIASSLHSESLIHQIDKTKAEVEELRADYTTQQADFMKAGKQSEIIKRVESMGIEENKTPPTKIIVKDW
ncbi:MAG: FtsL-like putative cell division protein [Flectobacillus sp.]|uniref:FtsL-like putative cell division protein n=1 Tax=Flectobacillus sp. TaxID=50419 RepID=UPI003B99C7DF